MEKKRIRLLFATTLGALSAALSTQAQELFAPFRDCALPEGCATFLPYSSKASLIVSIPYIEINVASRDIVEGCWRMLNLIRMRRSILFFSFFLFFCIIIVICKL